jgi:hypothetical protein
MRGAPSSILDFGKENNGAWRYSQNGSCGQSPTSSHDDQADDRSSQLHVCAQRITGEFAATVKKSETHKGDEQTGNDVDDINKWTFQAEPQNSRAKQNR